MSLKKYTANNVFTLKQAYEFAEYFCDTKVAKLSLLIEESSMPESLHKNNQGTQARRILMFLLFLKYGAWRKFENKYWPYNEGIYDKYDIINELLIDFLDSGKLSKHKNDLPTDLQELAPW